MRFHLIDRIDSWEAGRRISGRKVTNAAEEFWRPGPGGPVMPRPLVLEALCQAGTWLVMLGSDYRRRAALLSLGAVSFDGNVRPGDVLSLDARITSMTDDAAMIDGTVRVGDTVVLGASDIMCSLLDASTLDDPAASRRMGAALLGGSPAGAVPAAVAR
jgi:3-hydroxyacyl-[acyl-carrier-protein] dehydratase